MVRIKRKRPSTTNDEPKPKSEKVHEDSGESDSDSDSESDKTGDKKHRRKQLSASPKDDKKNGTIQSGEDDESESESDDENLLEIAERSTIDKKREVDAIISNKVFYSKMKYLLKWKDGSETWETKKKTTKLCPNILLEYTEDAKKAFEVEAIVSQRRKNSKTKYLIKWKDQAKGETWETEFRARQLCPELVTSYAREMEIAQQKAVEVEAIVEHKKWHTKTKYLIKWKDPTKGETWETVRKTIAVCPDILDEYMKDKPNAVPTMDHFTPLCYWWYKEQKDKPKRNRRLFSKKKLSDEEDDDEESDKNVEWEVSRIVKHRNRKDKKREFLIRWKGR